MKLRILLLCAIGCALIMIAASSISAEEQIKDKVNCYTTWDDVYIYLAFKVDCPNVQGTHKTPNADVTGDDSVTVFVDAGAKQSPKINPQCFSLTVSAAGGAQFKAGNDSGSLMPVSVWKFKYGAAVQGTINNDDDVDLGYTVEMAIPWELMGTKTPKFGDMMTFNILIRRNGDKSINFVSLTPKIATEEDVINPSKWMKLVFAAYTFGAVMQGGEKTISPKTIVRPPLINGIVSDGEWSKNSLFTIDLPMPPGYVYEAKYPTQKLIFTRYFYNYQRDSRKSPDTYTKLAAKNGGVDLQDFPAKSLGPWFSFDRPQWHKGELTDIIASGINVVLPVYRGDKASRAAFATKGLDCLVSALAELKSEGKPYPLVAMSFDTSSMQAAYGSTPDFKDDEVKRTFYGMIKDFYERVPADYRAFAQAGKPRLGRPGNIVFLDSSQSLLDVDESTLQYSSDNFVQDFGYPLVWIASSENKTNTAGFDGFSTCELSKGWSFDDSGRIRLASISGGYDDSFFASAEKAIIRSRMGGQIYEDDWAVILGKTPQWLLCDSWNDLIKANDICATREYGRKYIDATLANAKRFIGNKDFDAQYLRYEAPEIVPSKQFAQAELVIKNIGASPWRSSEGYALSYRWYKSGRFYSESKIRRPLERDVQPGETITVVIGIATVTSQEKPIADGNYELRFEMVRLSDNKWFSALGSQALVLPITIGKIPDWKATWLTSSMPVMLESGQDYPAKIRVRNDGSQLWRSGVIKLSCRLYKASNYTHDSPNEISEESPIKSIRMLLSKDCKPGEITELHFPINLIQPDKKRIPSWQPDNTWSYQLKFDLYNGSNWLSELGSRTLSRTVDIFDVDYGAKIVDSNLPARLSAGQSVDAKVVVRNNGVHLWDRKRTSIGYHWYQIDGAELQWDCDPTPLKANLQPGLPVITSAKVKAPDYDGQYILVWDVMIDGKWLSILPLTRGGDTLPVFVEVTAGKLLFADLSILCDVSAISPDTNRSLGDFDGKGSSFPSEYFPPDIATSDAVSRIYPSGYKYDIENRATNRVSFRYPEKLPDAKSAVACDGQKVIIDRDKYVSLNILGASTSNDAAGDFSLNYENSAQPISITMSDWGTGAKHGETIGYLTRHRHSHGGDEIGKNCYLYDYKVTLDATRALTSITLPKNPNMKIVAITLERTAIPTAPQL